MKGNAKPSTSNQQPATQGNRLMKRLPIGIQTFRKIIEENYLYVDKTEHIHRLIVQGSIYFLSRPRRFGKSLLISTTECLAEAYSFVERELVHGYAWKLIDALRDLEFETFFDTPENLFCRYSL